MPCSHSAFPDRVTSPGKGALYGFGDPLPPLSDTGRRILEALGERFYVAHAAEWALSRQHLIENDGEAVLVGTTVDFARTSGLFGRDVSRCAEQRAALGDAVLPCIDRGFCDAEVHYHRLALVHHHV